MSVSSDRMNVIPVKSLIVILIILLLAAGCTQRSVEPSPTSSPAEVTTNPVPEKPLAVTAQRIDSVKILIIYEGGPDADQLIELETTLISSRGSVYIRSMGSRLDTTPVQIGGTDLFPGPFPDTVHVLIAGYFMNGTHQDLLDTRI